GPQVVGNEVDLWCAGLWIGDPQRVERCTASQVAGIPVHAAGSRVSWLPEANHNVRLLQGILLLDRLIEQRPVIEDPEAAEYGGYAGLVQSVRETEARLERTQETRTLGAVGEVALRVDREEEAVGIGRASGREREGGWAGAVVGEREVKWGGWWGGNTARA